MSFPIRTDLVRIGLPERTIRVLERAVQGSGAVWTTPDATPARTAVPEYKAPTISNPPTQAEVQAIATQVAALTGAVAALVNDLKASGALS